MAEKALGRTKNPGLRGGQVKSAPIKRNKTQAKPYPMGSKIKSTKSL